MKKGTKFLLIGGLLLSVIGALIISAGAAVAGPKLLADMFAKGDFTVQLHGKDINILGGYKGYLDDNEGGSVTFANEETGELAKAEDVKKIKASMGGGILKIQESDKYENFTVKYEGSSDSCEWKFEDGILTIDNTLILNKKNGWSNNAGSIILYVPVGTNLEALDIELGGGEMKLIDIKAAESNVALGAGELTISGLVSQKLTVDVGAGEVKIENSTTDDLNIDMAMGESKYQGQVLKNADIECSMGEVDLELSGRKEDFNYTIECSAGEVEIEDSVYSGLGVAKYIGHQAEKEIVVNCAMGNVEIDFE